MLNNFLRKIYKNFFLVSIKRQLNYALYANDIDLNRQVKVRVKAGKPVV